MQGEYETTLRGFDITVMPSPEEGDNFDVYLYEGGNNVYQTTVPLPEDEDGAIEEEELINYAAQAAIDMYEAARNTLGQGAGATTARKVKAMHRQSCESGKWENWYTGLKGTPYEEQATTLLDQYISACYATTNEELRDAIADEDKILEELDRLNFERMKKADPRETIIVIGKKAQAQNDASQVLGDMEIAEKLRAYFPYRKYLSKITDLWLQSKGAELSDVYGAIMELEELKEDLKAKENKGLDISDEGDLAETDMMIDYLYAGLNAEPLETENTVFSPKGASKTAYFANVDDIQSYLDGFAGSPLEAQAVAKMKEYLENQVKIRNLQNSVSDGWKVRQDLEAAMEELALQQFQQGVIESAPSTGLESAPAMANDLAELMEGVDLQSPLEPMMAKTKKPDIEAFVIYEGIPGDTPFVPYIAVATGRDGYRLGDFEDKDDALKAIKEEMENLNIFPKVYYNDIEGHVTPIEDSYDFLAEMDKATPGDPGYEGIPAWPPKGGRFAKKAFEDVVRDVVEGGQWRGDLDPAEVYDKDFPFAVGDKVSLKESFDDVRWGGIVNKIKSGTKGVVDSLYDGHGDYVMVMLEPANLVRVPVKMLKKSGSARKGATMKNGLSDKALRRISKRLAQEEDSGSEIPIDLYVIKLDETENYNNIPEGVSKIYGVYLTDMNLDVHIASFQASAEMWYLESQEDYDDSYFNLSEEEAERKREEVFDYLLEANSEEVVDYWGKDMVENAPDIEENTFPKGEIGKIHIATIAFPEGEDREEFRNQTIEEYREHLSGNSV